MIVTKYVHSLIFASTILLLLTTIVNRSTLKLMPCASRTINNKLETVNQKQKFQVSSFKFQVKSGFTLIELLIVITIIGILASLTLASFNNAQQKARDGVRKSDLSQVKRALEIAKSDCKGAAYYPIIPGWANDVDHYNKLGTYLTDPDLKYISSAPKDPKDTSPNQYAFRTTAASGTADKCASETVIGTFDKDGASDYSMWTVLERTSDADALSSRQKCANKPLPGGAAGAWTNVIYNGYYVICNN